MVRFLLRFFIIFFAAIVISTIYLSYFGLETDKFNKLIKDKTNEVNQYIKLEFNQTKIYLNPKELNLLVKLQSPKILVHENEIILSKLDLFLALRSFFTSDFILKRAEVAFLENDVKDLRKITNVFLPIIINKKFNQIFNKGKLEGEFIIPFDPNGNISDNYVFFGKLSNAKINLNKELSIINLTAEIKHTKGKEEDSFQITVKKGSIYELDLAGSKINVERKEHKTKVDSFVNTKGKLNFFQIKKISSLFGIDTDSLKNVNGEVNLKTNIKFYLDNKFRLKNLLYSSVGDIFYLEIKTQEKRTVKKYLPDYDPKMIIKDTKIKYTNQKSIQSLELDGFIKVKDKFDNIKIKGNYKDKKFQVNGILGLTNSKIKISNLNYNKDSGKKSEIFFDLMFSIDNYYNLKSLRYISDKTKINLFNIVLNKDFEVEDLEKLEIKTFLDKVKNNDFLIIKKEKILISGEIFDAQPLLKSLYKKSDKKTFSKNFNNEIKINFNKALAGTNDDVTDFSMITSIKKGSYDKLILKGDFSDNEMFEMSLYKTDEGKKTLHLISDRAKPFIKNFDFIKGFEEGKLEYKSIISKKNSNSNLIITDFKVSKVPALAQLLTLASLQGIADTLSGEGIRFESF